MDANVRFVSTLYHLIYILIALLSQDSNKNLQIFNVHANSRISFPKLQQFSPKVLNQIFHNKKQAIPLTLYTQKTQPGIHNSKEKVP